MSRLLQSAGLLLFTVILTSPTGLAQVPENPLQPSLDNDWNYVSPGPAKCVEAGNVYLKRDALKGALSRFQEAVNDDPHYAPAYLGLGKVYERMNEKQKALDAYQRYLDELPSSKDAREAADARRAVARLRKLRNKTS